MKPALAAVALALATLVTVTGPAQAWVVEVSTRVAVADASDRGAVRAALQGADLVGGEAPEEQRPESLPGIEI